MAKNYTKVVSSIGFYALVSSVVAAILFPFYWLLVNSFEHPSVIYAKPTLLPQQWTLENYNRLFDMTAFEVYYFNTSLVAAGSIFFALLMASFAGYSLARGDFRGHGTFTLFTIATQFLPTVLLLIPLFVILQWVGLVNSVIGLMFTYIVFALPFSILVLKAYFESLPSDLEEAAMVDGCTRFQALYKIVLPLSKPGLIAAGTYCFVIVWQEIMFAITLVPQEGDRTISVGLLSVLGAYDQPWEVLFAGGVLATVPPIIIFIALQKYLIRGMTGGAVKQ